MTGTSNSQGKKILSRRARRSRNTRLFFAFALAVIGIFFLVFMYLNFFNIRKIEFGGISDEVYSPNEILEFIGVQEGDNLINVRAGVLEAALEKRFAYVERAEIKKSFPTTLLINLKLHNPSMAVRLGDDFFLMSSRGKVLDSVSVEEGIPDGVCMLRVPFVEKCIQGESVVFENTEIFDILLDIYSEFEKNELSSRLTSLDVTDKFNITAVLDGRFDIVFGTYEDSSAKVELLSAVMSGDLWTDSSGIIDISDSREAAVRLTGSAAN